MPLLALLALASCLPVKAAEKPASAALPTAATAGTPLVPPVVLPNGDGFTTWERPAKFTRTFYVDQKHPQASDENPGTLDRPFRTINRAAQVLRPGERVFVAAGIYRERVSPARGGTEPDKMISYEAAPGAEVIISGSRELPAAWTSDSSVAGVLVSTMPRELFEEENPFALINLTDEQIDRCMDWAVSIKGKPPITLRRGLVFQDSQRLKQVSRTEELAEAAGAYWVAPDGLTLHIRPLDNAAMRFEVTTRGFVFAPRSYGLGYIRVKGFTIQHSGNCFPRPQHGALSTQRGHHWLIEDNTVRQCNAVGIDIGNQFDTTGPELAKGGRHVVRRNQISDCGIGGIEGPRIEHTLIEENVIRRVGWQNIWRLLETGGIKVHHARSCVLRRNLITDTIGAPGIWMDYQNVNSRCTGNIILNAKCNLGALFMEASQQPNLVDNNIVWGTRGNGIYQHDCDELLIAHNLVGHSTGAGVRMQICEGRKVGGRLTTARRNRILNNVFLKNGTPLIISDTDNVSDYNFFADAKPPFDLAQVRGQAPHLGESWQPSKSWDRHSVTGSLAVTLNPDPLALHWTNASQVPLFPRVAPVSYDILGQPHSGTTVLPGPFAVSPSSPLRLIPGNRSEVR